MKNLKIKPLFLVILLLTLGCTALLKSPSPLTESLPTNQIQANKGLKCSFEAGFRDSTEDRAYNDLCSLDVEQGYRKGFLNGHSYLTRKVQVEPLDKLIKHKEHILKDLEKSKAVSVKGWSDLVAVSNEISKMKNDMRFLESEMNSYRNTDKY